MTSHSLSPTYGEYKREPQPWERQQDEPLDRYRWFQLYYSLPQPRTFTDAAQILGLKPGSRLVSKAAKDWRWKERAAATDDRQRGSLALQSEWRGLLLSEVAYRNRFITLEDTSRALASTAIGELDRNKARRLLGPLLRHQQGLLRLLEPKKQDREVAIDEGKLNPLILERRVEISTEIIRAELEPLFAKLDREAAADSSGAGNGQPDPGPDDAATDSHELREEDDPAETEPWHQQPGEPANHFRQFQIYLSLMFLQSTAQVAAMAKFSAKSTLDKIARKWDWQARAAAFDAHHVDQPLARAELQNRLLLDKAFTAHLHGLLDTASALQTAEIDRLTRSRARNAFSSLSRQQRNILQSIFRQREIAGATTIEERRNIRIAAMVENEAHKRAVEGLIEFDATARKIYGDDDEND